MRSVHFSWNCMQIWTTDSRRVKGGHYRAPSAYIDASYKAMPTISSRTLLINATSLSTSAVDDGLKRYRRCEVLLVPLTSCPPALAARRPATRDRPRGCRHPSSVLRSGSYWSTQGHHGPRGYAPTGQPAG
eukprot:360295-Chlamydomonas_euryale.AAC.2